MTSPRKRDKFDYAMTGIFICAIIVSFTHTIELYESAGFHVPIDMLNTIASKWLGPTDFFTLALFATIAAEAAFSVGLWGLYEAYREEKAFPDLGKYKFTWLMLFGGLVIIGWSNIGGTLGYNYLFGNPVKGYVLGLSIPYFVLNAILVNFSRIYNEESAGEKDKTPAWKKMIQTAKEIKKEVGTLKESPANPPTKSPEIELNSPAEITLKKEVTPAKKHTGEKDKTPAKNDVQSPAESQIILPVSPVENTIESPAVSPVSLKSENPETTMDDEQLPPAETPVTTPTEKPAKSPTISPVESAIENIKSPAQNNTGEINKAPAIEEKTPTQKMTGENDTPPAGEKKSPVKKMKKTPAEVPTKTPVKKRKSPVKKRIQPPVAEVVEIAKKYRSEHGELPGRPTLMELADCVENRARVALDVIKKEEEGMTLPPMLQRVK